jgi:metal-responsive CopG/Arc/MetJ family transcriptional regulator
VANDSDHPTGRLKQNRRIDVTLPALLVAELDRDTLNLGFYVSRSHVIEVAIRQFLDRGGVLSAIPQNVIP